MISFQKVISKHDFLQMLEVLRNYRNSKKGTTGSSTFENIHDYYSIRFYKLWILYTFIIIILWGWRFCDNFDVIYSNRFPLNGCSFWLKIHTMISNCGLSVSIKLNSCSDSTHWPRARIKLLTNYINLKVYWNHDHWEFCL